MATMKMHPQPSNLRASRTPRFASTRRPVQAILASSVAALLGLSAQPAFAATQTWSGASDANWAASGNWGALPATGDSLVFTSGTGLGGLTLSDNLMTPATFNVAGITFNSGAGAFIINPATPGTNGFTLTGAVTNNSTSLQTINSAIALSGTQTFTTTAGGGDLALGGVLSSTGGLTKAGTGTLTLSGSNSYTGATTLSAGTLQLGNANAVQNSTLTVNVNNGLAFLNGIGTFNAGALAGSGTVTLADTASSPVTLSVGGNNATTSYSGVLSGSGALIKTGTGTLTLGNYPAFSGDITVSGGKLTVSGHQYSTWNANNLHISNGTLEATDSTYYPLQINSGKGLYFDAAGGGIFKVGSNVNVIASAALSISTAGGAQNQIIAGTGNGNGINTNGQTVTFNVARGSDPSSDLTVTSIISNGGSVVKTGSGILTLTASNTYTGATTISAGTLQLGNANAVQKSTLTVNVANGVAFSSGIGTFNAGALSGSANLVLSDMASNPVTLSVGGNNANTTYSGVLSGSGNLTKNGTGTLNLSSTPTYTGSTTLANGTLSTTGTFGGLIGGPGSLAVYSGTLTLPNDSNSFGGNVTASGNTLKFTSIGNYGANSAMGTGGSTSVITVSNGGTLAFTGSSVQNSNRNLNVANGGNNYLYNNGTAALNLSGSISGNNQFNLFGSYTGVNVISGPLSDSGGTLSINGGGSGSWLLNNDNNSFSGSVGGNNLQFTSIGNYGQPSSLGTGGSNSAINIAWYGTMVFTGSTAQTSNRTIAFGPLINILVNNGTAPLNLTGSVTVANDAQFRLNGSNSNCGTISGPITGNSNANLIKADSGLWTLSGTNTYGGPTNISQGTLMYGKEVSLYNNDQASWTPSKIQVNNGATFGFYVGGDGEFTNSDVTTLLTNFAVATSGNGRQGGSKLAFDTTNASGGTFTIPDNIANTTGAAGGAIGLTKYGPGTLVLAGTNSYTGATTISAGTLQFGDGTTGTVPPTSSIAISSGATLALNLANSGTFGAAIVNQGTINLLNTGTTTFTGSLSVYAFNQNGTGTTILACNNASYGTININAGVVQLNGNYAAYTSTINVGAPNGLAFGLTTGTIGGLTGTSGFVLATAGGAGVNLSVGYNNFNSTYSGAISGTSSASALTKIGAGTLTLAGSNSYAGPTTITGGVLQLGNANAVQNSTLTLSVDNSLAFSSGIGTFNAGALSGSANLVLSDTASSPVTLAVGGNNANTTYSGVLSGSGNLTKTGSGTLNLSSTPTYTGSTTIAGGTLATTGTIGGLIGGLIGGPGSLAVYSGTLTLPNDSNSFGGNVTASGNTLRFTSIGNYGANSALGTGGSNSVIAAANGGSLAFTGSSVQNSNRNFNFANGGNNYLYNNGTAALNLSGSISGNNQFNMVGSYTGVNVISGLLSDSGGTLSINGGGSGSWLLNNDNNSFSGSVGGNNLQFTSIGNYGQPSSLGTGGSNSAINIAWYGTMVFTGSTAQTSNRTIAFGPLINILVNNGTAPLNLTGSVTVANDAQFRLNGSNSNCGTISGPITGNSNANLIKADSGLWTLSGTNTYGGPTNISQGTLMYGKEVSLYNNDQASWTPSKIQVNNGATFGFYVGGDGEFTNSDVTTLLTNFAVATSGSGMRAGSKLAFDTTNAAGGTFTIPDVIANTTGAAGGAIGLTKYGAGTLVLTASNTYSGATTLNGGTLQIGDGTTDGSIASTSGIANNGSLVYNLAGSQTCGNVISGSGTLTKTGPGTLTLTGSNTYSGGTTVNTGTLQLGNAHALGAATGGLTVNGGTLDLNGHSASVGALSGAGGSITTAVSGTSTLTATVASGTSTYAGDIADGAGSVALTKEGAGKLILGGSLSLAALNANNGVAELTQSGSIGALTVSGSGAVTLTAHSGGVYKVIETTSLSITPSGGIDLWNNAMIVRASGTSENATNLATVKAAVNAASNGLRWNGTGVGSTTAYNEAQPGKTQALALMVYDNTVITQSSFEEVSGLGYFDSGSPVGFNQVLVKLTYLGDFNADGVINASDYTWLDGFALSGNVLGDLNGDGVVNATDYTWLDGSALNQSFGVLADSRSGILPPSAATVAAPAEVGAAPASPEAVPEPGTLGMLLAGALGLFGNRRTRKGGPRA